MSEETEAYREGRKDGYSAAIRDLSRFRGEITFLLFRSGNEDAEKIEAILKDAESFLTKRQ